MSRAHTPFRKADVERAVKGAISGGLTVSRVTVSRDGEISVYAGAPEAPTQRTDLEAWRASKREGVTRAR